MPKTKDVPLPTQPGTGGNGRISQAPGEWIVRAGGLGILPRRGFDPILSRKLHTAEGVESLLKHNPSEALVMLASVIPELDQARNNFLRLGITEGSARLKAMTDAPPQAPTPDGSARPTNPKAGDKVEAPDGSLLIEQFFAGLPAEVGGFGGCMEQNMQMVLYNGMAVVEGVPADNGEGLKEAWPIDPNTTVFIRQRDMSLGLFQRQVGVPKPNSKPVLGTWATLNMQRTFWDSLDRLPSNPYGQGTFATAINEICHNERFLRALDQAWKRVGLPKYDITYDFEMWTALAEKLLEYQTPEELHAWVLAKFNKAKGDFEKQDPDSAFWHAKGTEVNVTGQAGAWPDVPGIYDMRRWRLVIALKMLPTLMGIMAGSTETWSTTEWRAFTACLRSVVECAAAPLVKVAQLHLNLMGLPYTVELDYTPVASGQRLADAQAEQIEITNADAKEVKGYITHDEASMEITGSAAVGPSKADQMFEKGLDATGRPLNAPPPALGGNPDRQSANQDRAKEQPRNAKERKVYTDEEIEGFVRNIVDKWRTSYNFPQFGLNDFSEEEIGTMIVQVKRHLTAGQDIVDIWNAYETTLYDPLYRKLKEERDIARAAEKEAYHEQNRSRRLEWERQGVRQTNDEE